MVLKKRPRRLLPYLLAISILWAVTSFTILQWRLESSNDNNRNNGTIEKSPSSPSSSTLRPPRFILGIFSHDNYKMEQERRQVVRDTYLSFYKNHSTTDAEKNRICVLPFWRNNKDINQKLAWPTGCQMAYAFVVGGGNNETAPTELLNATTSSNMLTTSTSSIHNDDDDDEDKIIENDIVSLNIQENGEYGKSPTWFRFATLLVDELKLDDMDNIDYYIIKTDSDALLIPHRFFGWIQEQEEEKLLKRPQQNSQQTRRQRIYGGVPMDKHTCGWPEHDHCAQLRAPVYMGGALYFVSLDVAKYVTSPACSRKQLFLPHEDMAMANYVFSMVTPEASLLSLDSNNLNNNNNNNNITTFENPDAYLNTWKHPIKSPKRMWNTWRKFLTARRQRQRANKGGNNNNNTSTHNSDTATMMVDQ